MITSLPVLETERLRLRRLELSDSECIRQFAGASEVASTTLNIPHPYPDGAAEAFIKNTHQRAAAKDQYTFAITRKPETELIGCIGLVLESRHNKAEVGYWLGIPYWGQGYMTEALGAILHFGFDQVGLNRIFATHLTRNPASGRVMQKAGMVYEGTQRQSVPKYGIYEDLAFYAILREDYHNRSL